MVTFNKHDTCIYTYFGRKVLTGIYPAVIRHERNSNVEVIYLYGF
jgi:hypothetical protein